ncbi:transglutaminase-like cysteine peptidase [Modicisalibacter muralis]|uniref:transglutaminase-like cysteine peptidase n=1 Tax=Modicisalibacter muralis TaxID=119000 RepID=UPI001FE07FAD|nr:transglutaminase-like cysteine peptidase [Halomonas muralis]
MPPPYLGNAFDPSRRRLLIGVGATLLLSASGMLGLATGAMDPQRMRTTMTERYGHQGAQTLDAWLNLLRKLEGRDIADQLKGVNDFFNRRVRWLDDSQIWDEEDYWATPLETLGRGAGDCEDYSIAKYQTLKKLGVPGERLRMIYVRARLGRSSITQAHMVLGYYATPGVEPLVLDNLLPTILPAGERDDLSPVFSFSSDGLWAGGSSESLAIPTQRLSRWRNVLLRMSAEGFL